MSKNLKKIFIICFLTLLSEFCFALNLGEIDLLSRSNQAFLANIKLLSYTRAEIGSLEVRLASDEEYQKFGIEKHALLKKLKFSVEGNDDDKLYLQVHAGYLASDFPASFLLEVTWEGGQIIKRYDISPKPINDIEDSNEVELLQNKFQAAIDAVLKEDSVSSLDTNLDIIQHVQRLKTKQPSSLPLVEKLKKTPSGGIEYSPVEEGESVSKIAKSLAVNKEISMNQVMLALYKENPDAFVDNNINLLRMGVTLKIEDEASIALVSKKEATRLVQQYMSNADSHEEFDDSLLDDNALSKDIIKPDSDEKTIVKHLEIVNASDDQIPQDILKRIKSEELAKAEELERKAQEQVEALESEIRYLKKRILSLESNFGIEQDQRNFQNVDLALEEIISWGDSATDQNEDLLIVGTGLSLEEKEDEPFIVKYKMTMLLSAAILLLISLLVFRYKSWLSTLILKVRMY